ncbi:hypothetical protein DOTSEDRAFT_74243 [Lecanosticta acicola]|uniref:Uncharacterized protein n=1 Tax=Lecanosticta acicola TaxID=111012 RepID=A0AAI8Z2R5_9PEZI|nr:hypothetical protein DOTSEDRAFT_74243 [Lecanosticta acicola]
MSARSRLVTKDEELGKRDDDFKPRHSSSTASLSSILPWRWRKRRLLLVAGVIFVIYMFTQQLPTDIISIRINTGGRHAAGNTQPSYDPYAAVAHQEPAGAPPRDKSKENEEASKHYYNGIVRFYKLAQSLHKISRTYGNLAQNRNVLWAASSLKSAANLMPMACEMAKVDRTHVHLAIFGRSTLALEEILALNGVDEGECKVYFHDARGDYADYSSDARAESATKGAMNHINDFMHPQVVIMDDSAREDAFFTKAMRTKAKEFGKSLIEVPGGRYEQFLWITRLEAGSLASWFKPNVEIVIHAPPGTSGSLIRLLQSMYNADYHGLKVPKLTIELPSKVEPALSKYLSDFQWPPRKGPMQADSLSIRHRIPSSQITSEQASIRFAESFYPSNPQDDHILMLSPQVELNPLYAQYLHFAILEYHYAAWGTSGGHELLGISLDVPTTHLNNNTALKRPSISDMGSNKYADDTANDPAAAAPFLYQATSSTANLIFGDRWTVFHDFLTKRTQASHSGKKSKTEKLVPETEPAWVEFLLELTRARGWSMLHPAFPFVTIHNELAQIPEEFARPPIDPEAPQAPAQTDRLEEEPFVLSAEAPVLVDHIEADTTRDTMALHKMLPFNGELQDTMSLPHLTHEGDLIQPFALSDVRDKYVPYFRAAIGGCQGADASRERVISLGKTDDLFCLPGIDVRFADETYPARADQAKIMAEVIADVTDDPDRYPMPLPTSTSVATAAVKVKVKPTDKLLAEVETEQQLLAEQKKLDVT